MHQTAPRHNCSLEVVVEEAEVCTPTLTTSCSSMDLPVKRVKERRQCETIARTVCTASTEVVENEVCVYTYVAKSQDTVASTVSLAYSRECRQQAMTECQHGHHTAYSNYGSKQCKEVAGETCYNLPRVTPLQQPVTVTFPEAVMRCENRPIDLPRVSCENMMEEKCFMVPEIMEDTETVEKCEVMLGAPDCRMVELSLPKQVCRQIDYGLAYNKV